MIRDQLAGVSQRDLRRGDALSQPFAHLSDGLIDEPGRLAQAFEEILVVFRVRFWNGDREIGELRIDAAALRDLYAVGTEALPFDVVLGFQEVEVVVQPVLRQKPGPVDEFDPPDEIPRVLPPALDGLLGVVTHPVVVASVADGGRARRILLQPPLPLIHQQLRERRIGGGRLSRGVKGDKEQENGKQLHAANPSL